MPSKTADPIAEAWSAVDKAMPAGWELRGVAKGPREVDPVIRSASWKAWARPLAESRRVDQPPSVEGSGASAEEALEDLIAELRQLG